MPHSPSAVAARTTLLPVPLAPELSVHRCDGAVGLFDLAGGGFHSDEPPPFWAFVWAGGQALARYILDNPDIVRGRQVWDIAAGSGVAALAAARSGAAAVTAVDVDPAAATAVRRNAAANDVSILTSTDDLGGGLPAGVEVMLAGDVFYSARTAERMSTFLRAACRARIRVLVGDPGRGFFPEHLFDRIAEYAVPVPVALEETETLVTSVWEMRATERRVRGR